MELNTQQSPLGNHTSDSPIQHFTCRVVPTVWIKPSRGWRSLDCVELWRFRELLVFLALRDIKVRYKQTLLGIAWVLLQPLLTMIVFTIFFGNLGKIPSDDLPYPLFVLTGLIPWQLFSHALTQASGSLVAEQRLVTKVYFPRLIVPFASVIAGLLDCAIACLLVLAFMIAYGIPITWTILFAPLVIMMTVLCSVAVGVWLAALNVQYRDVRYTIPFITQLWLFVTPVAYPVSLIPEKWRQILALNPMAGIVESFRFLVLGQGTVDHALMATSFLVMILLLIGGMFYFRRMEATFADIV